MMKCQFSWWRKLEETTDLRQVADKLSYTCSVPSPSTEPRPQRCEARWSKASWEQRLSSLSYQHPPPPPLYVWIMQVSRCQGSSIFSGWRGNIQLKQLLIMAGIYSTLSAYSKYSCIIPVKSTDFGGSLPIFLPFLPSYRQPTDLPQSTDFYRFFRGSTEF